MNRRSRSSDRRRSVERRLDLREHRVQREAEPSDLGALVGGLDAARQVARRDRPGGRADLLERSQADANEPPRQRRDGEQHHETDQQLDAQQPVQRRERLAHAGSR